MIRLKKQLIQNQNKLLTLFDQGLVSGVNFCVGILLARLLGIENYGIFVMLWLVVLFVSSIHQSALVSALFALLPKQKDQQLFVKKIVGLQFVFSVLVLFIICLLGFVVLKTKLLPPLKFSLSFKLLFLLGITTSLFVLNDMLRRIGLAIRQPKRVLIMDFIGYGMQPIALFVLAELSLLSVQSALVVLSVGFLLAACYALFKLKCSPILVGWRKTSLEIWQYSRFLISTALLQWLSGNYYLIIAAGVLGPSALGVIRIAQNIMGVLHVLLIALENTVPIGASRALHAKGKPAAVNYIFSFFIKSAAPFLALISVIAVFRNQLIAYFYGNSYLDYGYVLLAFCGIYLLIFVGTQLRFLIRTMERNKLIFWSYVFTSIMGLSTANFFVRQLELNGVLLGIFLTQLFMVSFYLLFLKKELKWLKK